MTHDQAGCGMIAERSPSLPISHYPRAGGPGGAARRLVVSLAVAFPWRDAQVEAGAEFTQPAGYLVLAAPNADIGQAQPDHLSRAAKKSRQRGNRLSRAARPDDPGIGSRKGASAVRDGDDTQPRAGSGQQRHSPASAEYFVVKMSSDHYRAAHSG